MRWARDGERDMFACLWDPVEGRTTDEALLVLARSFSPRVARRGPGRLVLDASGLERLFGDARGLGEAVQRAAADRGRSVQVAVAPTCTAAELVALSRPGVTVVPAGELTRALAPLPLTVVARWLEGLAAVEQTRSGRPPVCVLAGRMRVAAVTDALATLRRWGVRVLGELAALPRPDLFERLGPVGVELQRLACGEDLAPLVPEVDPDPFEATLEFEWPIDRLEPLAFALDRVLVPLCARLERADAGAAQLQLVLRLTTRAEVRRTLTMPVPLRDPRLLRTLLRLDLEASLAAHPGQRPRHEAARWSRAEGELPGVEALTVHIDPAPARVVQGSLLARSRPAPEGIATLVARLGALMGEGRVGAPDLVDSHRPGAFRLRPFDPAAADPRSSDEPPASGLVLGVRRLRVPVPARVALERGRPVDVRVGYPLSSGGRVVACAGPWRTSGQWWHPVSVGAYAQGAWDRDEWDVLLSDGGVYRVFRDRRTDRWFVDGIVD